MGQYKSNKPPSFQVFQTSPLLSTYFCVETSLKQRYCDRRRTHPRDPDFCLDQRAFLIPTTISGGVWLLLASQLMWMSLNRFIKYLDYSTNCFCAFLWLIATPFLIFERMEWSSFWLDWKGKSQPSFPRNPYLHYRKIWKIASGGHVNATHLKGAIN